MKKSSWTILYLSISLILLALLLPLLLYAIANYVISNSRIAIFGPQHRGLLPCCSSLSLLALFAFASGDPCIIRIAHRLNSAASAVLIGIGRHFRCFSLCPDYNCFFHLLLLRLSFGCTCSILLLLLFVLLKMPVALFQPIGFPLDLRYYSSFWLEIALKM